MIHLFIDANIYLNFYHFSKDDLVELEKLVELTKGMKISLLKTPQLVNEIDRNRDSKIADALKNFEDQKFKCSAPVFVRDSEKFGELQSKLNDANKLHSELLAETKLCINKNTLKTDKLIRKLLQNATLIDGGDNIFGRALERFRMGNPPGKKNVTVGDEINWEHLLSLHPHNEDLHLISGDSDFSSKLDAETISSFLKAEWAEKKASKIHFYSGVGKFFKQHFPNIKIASDVEISMAIEKLATSGSFATTHIAISMLQKFDGFSINQANELVEIAISNNQVAWIIDDDDVQLFYSSLLKKYGKHLNKENAELLTANLEKKFEVVGEGEAAF